jgi:hypothetical protein
MVPVEERFELGDGALPDFPHDQFVFHLAPLEGPDYVMQYLRNRKRLREFYTCAIPATIDPSGIFCGMPLI